MDESAWFGSMYNVIGLVLVLGVLMTQLFNISPLQALTVPFALIGLLFSGGGIGMFIAAAIVLLALFFKPIPSIPINLPLESKFNLLIISFKCLSLKEFAY